MNSRYYKHYIALQTVLFKEIVRFARIWSQTLLPPAITMTLYFIIFGKLIGTQIGNIGHYTYMQYIVPGLIMMAIITSAYANTSSSFFGTKFSKSIEEMLVSSMPGYIILLGYMLGGRFTWDSRRCHRFIDCLFIHSYSYPTYRSCGNNGYFIVYVIFIRWFY